MSKVKQSENIKVLVRARPMNKKEIERGKWLIVWHQKAVRTLFWLTESTAKSFWSGLRTVKLREGHSPSIQFTVRILISRKYTMRGVSASWRVSLVGITVQCLLMDRQVAEKRTPWWVQATRRDPNMCLMRIVVLFRKQSGIFLTLSTARQSKPNSWWGALT